MASANYMLLLALTSQPGGQVVTDTAHLQLPINAVLMDQQDYEQGDTDIELRDQNNRSRMAVASGGGGRLSSADSSFRVRKDNRGYD